MQLQYVRTRKYVNTILIGKGETTSVSSEEHFKKAFLRISRKPEKIAY